MTDIDFQNDATSLRLYVWHSQPIREHAVQYYLKIDLYKCRICWILVAILNLRFQIGALCSIIYALGHGFSAKLILYEYSLREFLFPKTINYQYKSRILGKNICQLHTEIKIWNFLLIKLRRFDLRINSDYSVCVFCHWNIIQWVILSLFMTNFLTFNVFLKRNNRIKTIISWISKRVFLLCKGIIIYGFIEFRNACYKLKMGLFYTIYSLSSPIWFPAWVEVLLIQKDQNRHSTNHSFSILRNWLHVFGKRISLWNSESESLFLKTIRANSPLFMDYESQIS